MVGRPINKVFHCCLAFAIIQVGSTMDESVSNMVQIDDDDAKKNPPNKDKDNLEEENDDDHQHQSSSSSSSASTLPKPKKTNRLLKSLRTFFVGLFPIFGWFTVCPHHISSDLIAGVYLGLYQIPQCMAYSIIAKYPVVYLLRTNIISSTLYTVFGHHRRLSYGIFGLVSAMYFRIIIERLGLDDTPPEMAAILVTFLTGLFAMLAGLLHLGSLIRFIPYEVMSGYRSGVYVLIISLLVSPMSAWKSLKIGDGKQLMIVPDLFQNQLFPYLPKQLNWNGWLVSIGCLIILACFRILHHYWDCLCRGRWGRLRQTIRRIPVEAILIIIGIIVAKNVYVHSYRIFRFSTTNFGNETLISYPNHFQWTSFGKYIGRIWPECIHATILFVIYTHSLAIEYNIADTGRINRKKPKRQLYPKKMKFYRMGWRLYNVNQELRAKGLIDLVGSFFKCVPCGPSRIRSDRCRNVGACTQVSGLVASIVAMVVWLMFQGCLTLTPKCIAASIITFDTMVALLFEIKLFVNFWKVSIVDAIVWCLTFAAFILLNIEMSLYCSIGLSLLIYCFRTKNFKLFKFKQERALITSNNSVILVPESLLDSSMENTQQDDGDSNILQKIPKCVLKSITIYKVDQRLMTVSDIDGFVLDVCRKITEEINNSHPINRIIFDCRSFYYIDWASIRLIKAMVMRTIQVAESWTPAALSSSSLTMSTTDEEDKLKKRLVAVFVFPTRTIKMIHNGGRFNIDYYHSLHQTLHITMKGAINMVVNFPQRLMDYDQNNNYLDTVSSAGIMMNKIPSGTSSKYRSKEDIPATMNGDKTESNEHGNNNSNLPDSKPRKPAKSKLKKLPGKLMNLDCKRQKGILHHENAEKSNENIQRDSITAISFKKQNLDEEFDGTQPSTSTRFPRFEIVDEQSLASQSNISALTSFIETDSESERSERSESIGSILEPPPPSPSSLPKSNGDSLEKPTTSFQTTGSSSKTITDLSEIPTKEDETSDNGIEIIRPKVSDMKNILEKLLSGQS